MSHKQDSESLPTHLLTNTKYFDMIVTDFYQLFRKLDEQIREYYENDKLKTVDKLADI